MRNVIQHPRSGAVRSQIWRSIRSGEASYRQIESLYAQNRLQVDSVTIDASKAKYQHEFIAALIDDGVEVTLDTKCAELSEVGRYSGFAKGAPWSHNEAERPLSLEDFNSGATYDLFGQIARQASELNVSAVQSPSHFLRDESFEELIEVDINSVFALRAKLDAEGRNDIAIDYALIIPHVTLQSEDRRRYLIGHLSDLPIDNLVIRLSRFGSGAGNITMKRTFEGLWGLRAIEKPIVLDHVGGLIGLGALALNVASGIVHGVGDRFNARDWHKKRKPDSSERIRGRRRFIPLPHLDKSFTEGELATIRSIPGGRRKIACGDKACCGPTGLSYLNDGLKAHIAFQTARSLAELSGVPVLKRAEHFMNHDMRDAERKARDLENLKTGNEKLDKKLLNSRVRINSMSRTFESLLDYPDVEHPPLPQVRRRKKMRTGIRKPL